MKTIVPNNWKQSFYGQYITSRSYCRPLNEDGTVFESREMMIDRTIQHQRYLWEIAKGKMNGESKSLLNESEENELSDLRQLMLNGEASLAGRTLWLGGTDVSKKFHASQFNCAFLQVRTVHDVVDAFHLLLLGCFHPDTKVKMEDGSLKPISHIKVGDCVMSFNLENNTYVAKEVLDIKPSIYENKVAFDYQGTKVITTDNHRFLFDNTWKRFDEMDKHDGITQKVSFTNKEVFYDLTVADTHNFVLENGLIAHNCGVGFTPVSGILNGLANGNIVAIDPQEGELAGFIKPVEVEVIRSTRLDRGNDANIEEIYRKDGQLVWHLKVGDSGLAWAKAAGKILAMKKPVNKIILDFSEIRPGGKPLRGFGWISSGDEQISIAFEAICKILSSRVDTLLTKIDILDIMNWLGTSLSSRRSAEMALLPADDLEAEEFAVAKKDYWKKGNYQRAQSNNSLLFNHKPTKRELRGIFSQMLDSGGSEPGFVNGTHAKKKAPWFSGLNPCGEILLGDKNFCVSGETKLITKEGISQIKDSVGKDIEIWNGEKWAKVKPFKTGDSDTLMRVTFGDGSFLDVTENHRFFVLTAADAKKKSYNEVLAKNLLKNTKRDKLHTEPFLIDYSDGGINQEHAYTIGFYVGDGCGNHISIYTEDKKNLPLSGVLVEDGFQHDKPKWRLRSLPFDWNMSTKLKHDLTPVFSWNKSSIIDFISGLADADGTNSDKGAIRIYQQNEGFIRDLQLLLTKVGIKSSVNLMSKKGVVTILGTRKNDCWYSHISNTTALKTHRLSHVYDGTGKSGKGMYQVISNVEYLDGKHETFCFNEPETTKGVFGNSLTGQCNLVTIDLGKFNGRFNDLENAFRIMMRANYRQTCVDLRDGILQHTWHELNEFLRLTGCCVAGIVRWEYQNSPKHIAKLKKWAQTYVDTMSNDLNTPKSKAFTSVKPDGCLFSETKVKTDKGVLSLRELFALNDYIPELLTKGFYPIRETIKVLDMNNNYQEITELYVNGLSDTIDIEFEDGTVCSCTKDHKFLLTTGEWKPACELSENDDIKSF